MSGQKKGAKVGRKAAVCKAYRASYRREFNKMRRLIKMLRNHSANRDIWEALVRLAKIAPPDVQRKAGLDSAIREASPIRWS